MLTARENFLETIRGGNPDRFVKQYEYMELIIDPIVSHCSGLIPPNTTVQNDWGVTITWAEGQPGPFPVESAPRVIDDVACWKEQLKAPDPHAYSQEEWATAEAQAAAVDRKEKFVAPFFATGIFEKLHYLMGMEECLVAFYEEPEAMHELIDFLADWEIECAKVEIDHLNPDALFHHDDWGSQISTFLSPDMFEEFLVPAYKKVYGFWKEQGIKVIVHHSDSYAATLVPYMIEMGIDVWQGPVSENNLAELVAEYGGQISFHCGLDNGKYDHANWSKEDITAALKDFFETVGTHYIIPGFTQGGPGSTFPGAYEAADEAIDDFSKVYFR